MTTKTIFKKCKQSSCINEAKNFLTLSYPVLHDLDAEEEPEQEEPPQEAAVATVRFLIWLPKPHVIEQAPHCPHVDHAQLTAVHLLRPVLQHSDTPIKHETKWRSSRQREYDGIITDLGENK